MALGCWLVELLRLALPRGALLAQSCSCSHPSWASPEQLCWAPSALAGWGCPGVPVCPEGPALPALAHSTARALWGQQP